MGKAQFDGGAVLNKGSENGSRLIFLEIWAHAGTDTR